MWWVIGALVWLFLFVVVVALCRAASEGDRKMKERKPVQTSRPKKVA